MFRFILRFGVSYALTYLAWLPLREGFVRVLSVMARNVLAIVEHPPIITALTTDKEAIVVYSYITGLQQPIASWNAQNLHIFVVTSLALLFAVPLNKRPDRIRLTGWSLSLVLAVTLAICVVQLKSVAEAYAFGSLGITLHTAREKALLDWANRGLIMLGMLILPAFVFLTSYVSFWSESQVRPEGVGTRAGRGPRQALQSRARWRVILPWVAVCAGLWVLLGTSRGDPSPRTVLEGLNRIVTLNPTSAQARFSLGVHHESEGRLDAALESYQEALRLDPNLVTARFGLGNVLYRQGRTQEAAQSFEEVRKRDDGHAPARYNLGNALFEMGQYGGAVAAYEEAVRLNPNHASAQRNLGASLVKLERPCEALGHLERSARLDGRNASDAGLASEISRLRVICRSPEVVSRGTTLAHPGNVGQVVFQPRP